MLTNSSLILRPYVNMIFSAGSFNVIEIVDPEVYRQWNSFESSFQHLQHTTESHRVDGRRSATDRSAEL